MLIENAGNEFQLYVSPVNFKPDDPAIPISTPASFSKDLYKAVGNYRTLGWAEATWPLNENRMDEKTFMDDLMIAFDDRAKVILNRVDANDWDLLVGVIESTDRVQHMMWRLIDPQHPLYDAALASKYGDSIERVYKHADDFVGEVVRRVGPGVPVLIVSDHGFHSWRKAVNLNTWLVEHGYMTLKGHAAGRQEARRTSSAAARSGKTWTGRRTRAYAMGLGQIYFNLRGREAQGIVSPGAEAAALADELAKALRTMTDPDDGTSIIRAVYKRDDIYSGPYLPERLGAAGRDGGRLPRVVADHARRIPARHRLQERSKKWSGDHGGYDYAITSGILVSSRPINTRTPSIMDIAPTVLRYFGLAVPKDIDGKPLF